MSSDAEPIRVYVFSTRPEDWPGEALAEGFALLDAEEQRRAQAFVRDDDRRLYITAHTLLRRAIAFQVGGVTPAQVRFERSTSKHRPRLVHPASKLRFSLSHTRGLAGCVLTMGCQVGFDLERGDGAAPMEVSRYFAPEEQEHLRNLPEPQRSATFFRYWTLKEAYTKGLGLGLAFGFDGFVVELQSEGGARLRSRDGSWERRWQFRSWAMSDEHWAGLAVESTAPLHIVAYQVDGRGQLQKTPATGHPTEEAPPRSAKG